MGKVSIPGTSPDTDFHGMSRIRKAIAKHSAIKQKCWRDNITFDMRKDVMIKFAKAIFPPFDSNATTSTLPGRQHLEYARQMECQIFQTARDYDEYVKKIGQEISKVAEQWTDESTKPTASNSNQVALLGRISNFAMINLIGSM
uniref:KIX domain-containing protein n=1 Tax=Steinernema glaseri TaxID=37863 RepID=A0A1I7YAK3_9BILA